MVVVLVVVVVVAVVEGAAGTRETMVEVLKGRLRIVEVVIIRTEVSIDVAIEVSITDLSSVEVSVMGNIVEYEAPCPVA